MFLLITTMCQFYHNTNNLFEMLNTIAEMHESRLLLNSERHFKPLGRVSPEEGALRDS